MYKILCYIGFFLFMVGLGLSIFLYIKLDVRSRMECVIHSFRKTAILDRKKEVFEIEEEIEWLAGSE